MNTLSLFRNEKDFLPFSAGDLIMEKGQPGDVMYVPPYWWHQVRNPTPSIGVGYRFNDLPAMGRGSATQTLLLLLATDPPLYKTLQLKGEFAAIFAGTWRD